MEHLYSGPHNGECPLESIPTRTKGDIDEAFAIAFDS